MSNDVHLDTVIDQIGWISTLFKKCGAQIETKGNFFNLNK